LLAGVFPYTDDATEAGTRRAPADGSIPGGRAASTRRQPGAVVGVDNPTSSEVTRKVLGWQPEHPGLIEDLEHGHYLGQV
jgi:hypothetical protein